MARVKVSNFLYYYPSPVVHHMPKSNRARKVDTKNDQLAMWDLTCVEDLYQILQTNVDEANRYNKLLLVLL